MSTATATAPSDQRRGFPGLRCSCGGEEGQMSISLDEPTGSEAIRCGSCDNAFSVADVRAVMATWSRVIGWVEAAPLVPE
jgi:hypothetical protein